MLSGCRKSSLQIDVILYEGFILYVENKTLHCGSTRLTSERAERDKDPSEQQLNNNINKKSSAVQ